LAKKAKTPPPPKRPVQAPKQRVAPRSDRERRTLLYLVGFAGLGIVLLVGALGLLAFGGGGGGGGGGTAGLAGINSKVCVEKSYPGLSPKHLSSPDEKVKYNSFPPSSGPHYQSPAPWNLYTDPVKETILVHNLEHGAIVVQYGPGVSQDDVKRIQSFYQGDPYGLVVAPFPELKNKIALTSWNEPAYTSGDRNFKNVDAGKGYVMTCTKVDERAFAKFRDAHRNKSGERYTSIKDMAPGS
jgi:hypothetical protein